ncbi:glycosyltransferase [Hymenobacter taeanensis]|uniref:Glycosyltransferase n=1 Tax=Hymenobacter taeanensis TaxID=2735321 RepID=A0A6M6BJQ8_9BACT|nr:MULTISPECIES: glycosyltransferase [Hymenobacter]QJX47553.1 glycosyltransferase [Hymenobacter taeanensis]UOQ82963.1 glycosyltransferase [Hymenobacter sp. 5414T-23]
MTVIIPNFNHANYLVQRIESVLQQTERDIEVLLLDDCSTDNSRDIIARYAAQDTRIQVVLNEHNSGSTFKQWIKGIGLAKGEYIWIAESDDYAEPNLLEVLLSKMESDSSVCLSYSSSWEVDEQNKVLCGPYAFYESLGLEFWQQDFILDGTEVIERFMSYRNVVPNASAVLLRRSCIDAVGMPNSDRKLVGDWQYWIRIMQQGNVAYHAAPLNYFRQHSNNVRSNVYVNGVVLEEEAYLLAYVGRIVPIEKSRLRDKVSEMNNRWFYSLLYYNLSKSTNKNIYKYMCEMDKDYNKHLTVDFVKFLFKNKCSGLRQIIGDKVIYKMIKK